LLTLVTKPYCFAFHSKSARLVTLPQDRR